MSNTYGGDNQILGTHWDDLLLGTHAKDTIFGRDGHDHLYGKRGNDYLNGGRGNDLLEGGDGDDKLKGEAGHDRLYGQDGKDKLYGGDGDDFLKGGRGKDELYGGDGCDYLNGGEHNDYLKGEAGNDILIGGGGNDKLKGGDGKDRLNGFGTVADHRPQFDKLYGGNGSDIFVLGGNWGVSYFEEGDGYATIKDWDPKSSPHERSFDRIEVYDAYATDGIHYPTHAPRGHHQFYKGYSLKFTKSHNIGDAHTKDTEIYFTNRHGQTDRIAIVEDSTDVNLRRDFNFVTGGRTVAAQETDSLQRIVGRVHGERLTGTHGDDAIYGRGGSDTLKGLAGDDVIYGDRRQPLRPGSLVAAVFHPAGNDDLWGGAGNDALYGDAGNDRLVGGLGHDKLVGGQGNDRLNGFGIAADPVTQYDKLHGGAGSDTFILGGHWGVSYFEQGDGYAVIQDWDPKHGHFDHVYDRIEVLDVYARGGHHAGHQPHGHHQFYKGYSLKFTHSEGIGDSHTKDTEIYFTNQHGQTDRIGIIADSTNVNIRRDFSFV